MQQAPVTEIKSFSEKLDALGPDYEVSECKLQLQKWEEDSRSLLASVETTNWIKGVMEQPSDGSQFDFSILKYHCQLSNSFPDSATENLQRMYFAILKALVAKASMPA